MMLSVIIPAYKEKENLEILLPQIQEHLEGIDHEIIIVDDDSKDGTEFLISQLKYKYPNLIHLRRAGKCGLTSAIVDGVKISKGEKLLVMDADLSHPASKTVELIKYLDKFDLVVGSRNKEGGGVENWPLHRKIISKVAETLARLILGVNLTDPMSGFFAIHRKYFLKTKFRIKGYKILLNILADNRSMKVKEVPYVFRDRHAGATKLGSYEIIVYLYDLIRIRLG